MAHQIDCHVLTLPHMRRDWMEELRGDLDGEPVNQLWTPGTKGDLARSRIHGYSLGEAPFVTSADADDRIVPGVFEALRQALIENPSAPFAWAGERWVDAELRTVIRPPALATLPIPHGVKMYRREAVNSAPAIAFMRKAGMVCETALDLYLVRPFSRNPRWPVMVGRVGRLWRLHGSNGSRLIRISDHERLAKLFGFKSLHEFGHAFGMHVGPGFSPPRRPRTPLGGWREGTRCIEQAGSAGLVRLFL